jgi:hypothetical protein
MGCDNNDGTAFPCMAQASINLDADGDPAAFITHDFADADASVSRILADPECRGDYRVEMTTLIKPSTVAYRDGAEGAIRKALIIITTAFILSPLPSAATPCMPDIDHGWAQVNLKIHARISAGRSAPQSSIALLHRQPTPNSVAAAQDLLNDVWLPIEAAVSALSRARLADRDNDERTCRQALIEAQRAIDQ